MSTRSIGPPLIWICGCLAHDSAEQHLESRLLGILPRTKPQEEATIHCRGASRKWPVVADQRLTGELCGSDSFLGGTGIRSRGRCLYEYLLVFYAHWHSNQSCFVPNDTLLYLFSFTLPAGFWAQMRRTVL